MSLLVVVASALALFGGKVEIETDSDVSTEEEAPGSAQEDVAGLDTAQAREEGVFWPSGPVSELFGINEAISYPERRENEGVSESALQAHLAEGGELAIAVGATWSRGHTVAFPRLSWDRWEREGRSFDRADGWLRAMQTAGLEPIVMIGPWPGNRTRQATPDFELGDSWPEYLEFVSAVVERYDGDGVDDMEGLMQGVHHWEIDNEPDLKNSNGPRGQEATDFATAAQFGELIVRTSEAIRAADSEAVVLNGGIFKVTKRLGYQYALDLFAEEGVLDAVDVISVHAYHYGPSVEGVELTIARMQELAQGRPVWLTETGVPSVADNRWVSEEWQGEMVNRTVIVALSYGVEHIFWHTLFDPPARARRPRAGYGTHSLHERLESGGVRMKPSGESYRRLAGLLRGVDWSQVFPVEVGGGSGVSIGDRRLLVFPDGVDFEIQETVVSAVDLRTGEEVSVSELSGGGFSVQSNGYSVLISY
jgi:hypothetical protein